MIGKFRRTIDYRLAIAGLALIVIGAIIAGVYGGLRLAGLAGFLLFIFLDGLNCSWTVLNHSRSEKIHEEMVDEERSRLAEYTKDNPTLR